MDQNNKDYAQNQNYQQDVSQGQQPYISQDLYKMPPQVGTDQSFNPAVNMQPSVNNLENNFLSPHGIQVAAQGSFTKLAQNQSDRRSGAPGNDLMDDTKQPVYKQLVDMQDPIKQSPPVIPSQPVEFPGVVEHGSDNFAPPRHNFNNAFSFPEQRRDLEFPPTDDQPGHINANIPIQYNNDNNLMTPYPGIRPNPSQNEIKQPIPFSPWIDQCQAVQPQMLSPANINPILPPKSPAAANYQLSSNQESKNSNQNKQNYNASIEVGVEDEEFYHGYIPSDIASDILQQHGDFLLRITDIGVNAKMCLSIRWNDRFHHVALERPTPDKFRIPFQPTNEFSSICDLVEYFSKNCLDINGVRVFLLSPILRQPWELKHMQIETTKKLGEGAFGEVYRGIFAATQRFKIDVAVKVLKGRVINKKLVMEMMAEAKLMRDFRHPNVVRFYGYAADHIPLMIVMELASDGALDIFLIKNGWNLGLPIRLSMSCDAALGIEYVHGKTVMHRDIAARNCLYSGDSLKLSDFGMSRRGIKYHLVCSDKTPVRWTAPEVFSTGIYTQKSDVWSFGILMWEIFQNANEPYKGWKGEQIKTEIFKGYRLKMPDTCPAAAKEIFNQTMAANSNDRPTINILARELEHLTGRASSQPHAHGPGGNAHENKTGPKNVLSEPKKMKKEDKKLPLIHQNKETKRGGKSKKRHSTDPMENRKAKDGKQKHH